MTQDEENLLNWCNDWLAKHSFDFPYPAYDNFLDLIIRLRHYARASYDVEKITQAVMEGNVCEEYYHPPSDSHRVSIDRDKLRKVIAKAISVYE